MKKFVTAIANITVIASTVVGSWYLLDPHSNLSGKPESLTIGIKPAEANALIYIAEDQGFFAGNSLNVAVINYSTKLQAFKGMASGDVNISIISEYPIVAAAFKKENISVIACTSRFQDQYLVGRKDRGIKDVSDLNGKVIGVPLGTIAEFYFGRFLDLHGMDLQDVNVQYVPFPHAADAFFNGSVDAVMIWDGASGSSGVLLGNNSIAWSVQSGQASYDLIACRNDWISSHPESITRFLISLHQAEEYLVNHPEEAKKIVQKRIDRPDAQMASIWPRFQFSLILDLSLVTAMEDEGRWMINNNLTTKKTIPNFRDYIYTKGLDVVKPEAMNIIV